MKNKKQNQNMWKKYLGAYFILFIFVLLLGYSAQNAKIEKNIAHAETISTHDNNIVKAASVSASLTPTPSMTANGVEGDIAADIRTVFGDYSDKAFLLLSCENKSLDPEAINDNTTWGGVGQDVGVFQINTTWQGVTNKAFLEDPAINIRIAYNIFKRSGHSFKMWSCGKNSEYEKNK